MLSQMNSQLSAYKYPHAGAAHRSRSRWLVIGVFLLLGLGVFLVAPALFPVGIAAWVAALIAYGTAPKHLRVGPRYVLCGEQIVYYGNVKRITLSKARGRLQLRLMNGQDFVLERDKFPTGARREPKITQNRTVKFDKVSSKLIANIHKAQPDVEHLSD